MKKVIVVSKTHLDLGFTDYAENIRQKYINEFIPGAISLAEKVNTDGKKRFVWTTGSWIIKEALEKGTEEQKSRLNSAIKNGNIVPHAMPFTTHTELLDKDTLDYGLSMVDELDSLRGRKTVAAKMTDVPGHTKGLVKLLAQHGIKLLHIGVNGASALVQVPDCFLWKNGEDEVVVIYSGDYGGAFKSDLVDEVLYFDHTLDNHGAPSPEKVINHLKDIGEKYPGYEITAGTMDDFADIIWEVREKLPVFEGEMGDTWIHGSATDPYKSAALRTLISFKNKWLNEGSLDRNSNEYKSFVNTMLCIAEHTCGMDTKTYFSDYGHYLKKDFVKARKADAVKIRHPFCDFPQNIFPIVSRINGRRKKGYYSVLEKSWAEQREYIKLAVSALNGSHKEEAEKELSMLIPTEPEKFTENGNRTVECGEWVLEINEKGGIGRLLCGEKEVIKQNNEPFVTYRSFCNEDYKYWLTHYSRNLKENVEWAIGDFGRPALKYVDGKFPSGRFEYAIDSIRAEGSRIILNLVCEKKLCEELGAPRLIQAIFTLTEKGLKVSLNWFNKDANRLTEAIYMHLLPATDEIGLRKLDSLVSPKEVVSKGSRKLHAVQSIEYDGFKIRNIHSPLLSIGKGKILEFDNEFENIQKDGISFVLYNNVWGTNFPLWYEDNAHFEFTIEQK